MSDRFRRVLAVAALLVQSIVFLTVVTVRSTSRTPSACYPEMWPVFVLSSIGVTGAAVILLCTFRPKIAAIVMTMLLAFYAIFLVSGGATFLCSFIAG